MAIGQRARGAAARFHRANRACHRERTIAGIRRAHKAGKKSGRRPIAESVKDKVRERIERGESLASIARTMKLAVRSVWSIKHKRR